MNCAPSLVPQLTGVTTGPYDCGVSDFRRAVKWASCGKVTMNAAEARRRMGKLGNVPTNPPDWQRAFEHPDTVVEFRKAGLQPPEVKRVGINDQGFFVGAPIMTAINALENGRLICVAETYRVWHGTKYAGSDTFQDNHAVAYYGIRGPVGKRRTTRYDPLNDGREPGIPDGPITVPFHMAADAMGGVDLDKSRTVYRPLGKGLWGGLIVHRALPIQAQPDPVPVPVDECDVLRNALAAAREAIASLRIGAEQADEDAADAIAAIDSALGEAEQKQPGAVPLSGID